MKKKQIVSLIILIVLMCISFHILLSGNNIKDLFKIIENSNWRYLFIAVGFMILYFGLEALMLKRLIVKIAPERQKISLKTAIKATLIGQYYNQITPLSSGGQPMQLFVLKNANISTGQSTVILLSKFLYFQIGVTLYAMVLTILGINKLWSSLNHAFYFVAIGLLVNVMGLSLIVLMTFKPEGLKRILNSIFEFLEKIHIVKNKERILLKVDHFIEEYKSGIAIIKSDVFYSIKMFGLTFIQLTLFFSITWLIYKALGLSGASIFKIVTLQALLYMAVSFVPVPGTMGASEAGFLLILGSVFTGQLATVALLLWRGISYYFSLIFCGMYTLTMSIKDIIFSKKTQIA